MSEGQLKQLTRYRRDLHRIPEVDFDLPKTRAYIISELSDMRCVVIPIGKASVCAFFDAGKTETFAFRSDMDALPVTEKNTLDYASEHPGRMHACGHDGHMAIMLTFAGEISRRLKDANTASEALPKNVLLIFQAAEETTGGAKEICDAGIFEKYNVVRVYGLHLWPNVPKGAIVCRKGEFMARTANMDITVTGCSAHVAQSENGIDAMLMAVKFVEAAYESERKDIPEGVFRLLKICSLHSGTANNVISGFTEMHGALRCFDEDIFNLMKDRLRKIADGIENDFGGKIKIEYATGYPAVINHDGAFEEVKSVLSESFEFIEPVTPMMTAEDFSFYQKKAPGVYFHLGFGEGNPLHSDGFNFDESVMPVGVEAYLKLLYGVNP